jgi:tRNA(Ile)-lysidine synthase
MKKSTIFFLKYTKKLFKKTFFFKNKTGYLLAFSGGQDSICLLLIFFILKKQFKFKIRVIFCNHLWQKDVFFTFLHTIKLSFCLKLSMTQSITNRFLINENTSRNWRIKIFSKNLIFFHFFGLLIGHSLNDRNETFLFNFFRGFGLFGIFALEKQQIFSFLKKFCCFTKNTFYIFSLKKKNFLKKNKITMHRKMQKNLFFLEKKTFLHFLFLRPMLFRTRIELKLFLTKLKLPIFSDLTNQKNFLSRNRIRKQFIPTIRFFFNKQIDFTINKYISILYEREKENLNFIIKFYEKIFYENKNFYFINFKIFKKIPLSIQTYIIIFFFKYKLKKNYNYINLKFFFVLLKTFRFKKISRKKKIQIISTIGIFFFFSNYLIFIK